MCFKMLTGELKVCINELNLALTLPTGQSFRWEKIVAPDKSISWIGVINDFVWRLRQGSDLKCIKFEVINANVQVIDNFSKKKSLNKRIKLQEDTIDENKSLTHNEAVEILQDYFQLGVDLNRLYRKWENADPNFAKISQKFQGVRVLRQDPVETLFAFICSSNNNIQRISKMMKNLSLNFGRKLAEVDEIGDIYSFPTLNSLSQKGIEQQLRTLGFGYRAKYIANSADQIAKNHSHPEEWLRSLRQLSYREARDELLKLPGIGAKVADCICLMALDKSEAVPVDTHVWQLTSKLYLPELKKTKTLTSRTYDHISDFYRNLFGNYAGWCQTVLFCSDLRQNVDTCIK